MLTDDVKACRKGDESFQVRRSLEMLLLLVFLLSLLELYLTKASSSTGWALGCPWCWCRRGSRRCTAHYYTRHMDPALDFPHVDPCCSPLRETTGHRDSLACGARRRPHAHLAVRALDGCSLLCALKALRRSQHPAQSAALTRVFSSSVDTTALASARASRTSSACPPSSQR